MVASIKHNNLIPEGQWTELLQCRLRVKSGLRGAVLGRSADGSEAEAGRHRRGAWISNSEVANRSAAEMVRSDGRLLDTRCHDAIMPLFCPTGQIDFVKSKKPNADKGAATVHGVVFANFACPRYVGPGPDLVGSGVA